MRIGFLVNTMAGHHAGSSTHRLAAQATTAGHEVWILSTGNFSYEPDDSLGAMAKSVPRGRYTPEKFLATLNGARALEERIDLEGLDVLFLRSNPPAQHAWAQGSGIQFGRLAKERGVLVLNDPDGLARASNKLYLQDFPRSVRPRTLVTRFPSQAREFLEEEGQLILKPLQGSGGTGVFVVRRDQAKNIEEIFRAVSRDGYVIAQEYLPAAAEGDTRLFLMNGVPLRCRGKYAAFRRVRSGDDLRSNIHAGGRLRRAEVTDSMLRLADIVRPRLVEDGMFLVGLDIVEDRLLEVNVFSPGGLGSAQLFEKVDFAREVLQAIDRKVEYARSRDARYANAVLATL